MRLVILMFTLLFMTPVQAETLTIVIQAINAQPYVNAKLLSKYMQKYHPSITSVIFKTVPGAGGMNAANYLYNVADRDGYTIGTFTKTVALRGFMGDKNAQYDPLKFTWLGSTSDGRKDPTVLISNKPLDQELMIGEQNSSELNIVDLVKTTTNLNIKKIAGYKDLTDIRMAYIRGEIDGLFNVYSGMMLNDSKWKSRVILQYGDGLNRHPELPKVPTLMGLTNDRKAIEVIEVSNILIKPFVAPPGIPPDKAALLREAFVKSVKDPDFIAEASSFFIEVTLIDHHQAEEILNQLSGLKASLPRPHLTRE